MSNELKVMITVGNHGILQSGEENIIFGYFRPAEKVSLEISDGKNISKYEAVTDIGGKWKIKISPFPASFDKYTFDFRGGDEHIIYNDIVFGELFHISGQSNMELPISRTADPFTSYEFVYSEFIREFRVPIENCFGKDTEYEDFRGGEWKTASEENLPAMSAAGYWFAVEIMKDRNVPVGLLNTSSGGAPVEARMSCEMLRELGGYDDFLDECTKPGYMENTIEKDRLKNEKRNADIMRKDKISSVILKNDNKVNYRKCNVPFYFRDVPELNGFCGKIWFRKKFIVPDDADISSAVIFLGAVTDADKVYLNGVYTGETGYMYPPRIYKAPAIKKGENTLLVFVDVINGKGGFVEGKRYWVKLG